MRKHLIAVVIAGLALVGCASDAFTQYARGQTAYNVALALALSNREICVAEPSSPACIVDDAAALKIEAVRVRAQEYLDLAYASAARSDDKGVERYLNLFEAALFELNQYLASKGKDPDNDSGTNGGAGAQDDSGGAGGDRRFGAYRSLGNQSG